ncbi:MAG: hypothetical protein J0L96_02450 [Anaerolineae bacterium]|nr:hypothetical protein [Anaerolineae bacterium]
MKFSEEETSFELSLTGYQFPNAINEPYDSNWLVVQLNLVTANGVWGISDPCLLTYDVSRLANWFDKIDSGNFQEKECDFLEPVLSFRIINNDGKKFLRVRLTHEAMPSWAQDQDEYSVEFLLSELDLKLASENLRRQLEKYPQRAAE